MPSFPHNVTFLPGLSPTVFPNTHLTPYGTFYGSAGFPLNGLVWNFTDNVAYAGAVHDSTAIGNDLMLHTGWYPSLDGIGDYIEIPHSSDFNLAGVTRTVSLRFRTSAYSGSNTYLISKNGTDQGGWALVSTPGSSDFTFLSKQASLGSNHFVCRFARPLVGIWNTVTMSITDGVLTEAKINGEAKALIISVAPTGTYGDSSISPLAIGAVVPNSGTPGGFTAGDFSEVSLEGAGHWLLNEHADELDAGLNGLPCFDHSGNGNHGEYVMCSGNVGEGMPDSVAKLGDYGDKLYFDGVDDQVAFGAGIHTTLSGASIFTLEFTTAYLDTTTANKVWYMTSGASEGCFTVRFNSASSLTVISRSETADAFGSITFTHSRNVNSEILDWRFEADYGLGKIRVYCDGVLEDTLTPANWTSATFDMIGSVILGHSTGRIKGGAWDVRVKKDGVPVGQWQGDGNTNADWLDQIGSNNGTVSGSPNTVADLRRTIPQTALQDWNLNGSGYYVPEDQSNLGFDALGNAIDKPRGNLLNPRGVAGDYAEILDDPSLDVTTEMSGALVGNLYPATASTVYIYHRYYTTPNKRVWFIGYFGAKPTGVIRFYLSGDGIAAYAGEVALPDADIVLSWTFNAGTFKVYINGTETTVTTIGANPVPASLSTTDLPIRLFQNFDGGNPSDKQFLPPLMYNRELSPSEHSDLYEKLQGLL
jgi:hypothetical protein